MSQKKLRNEKPMKSALGKSTKILTWDSLQFLGEAEKLWKITVTNYFTLKLNSEIQLES